MKQLCLIILLLPLCARPSLAGPAEQCRQVRNDDTIRPYDASLRPGLLKAYAQLFPRARMPPEEKQFEASAHIRCMDGRLLACFTGANLPCSRMDSKQQNEGASAYCKDNADAPFVPAFATGHDSAYAYRCVGGQALVTGETFKIDPRGFATSLWAPID